MSRIRHGSNFVVVAVSLFLILLVINVFSYRHFVRWDLTANRDYTISKATRDLLTSLDNLITVKVYLSKKMPAALLTFEEQLREVLAEYERYAKGKLRIEFVIPPDDETGQRELLIRGIQPQVVPQMQRDTLTQTVVYDAITMEYQNQREIIPHLYDRLGRGLRGDFEYLFTSRIAKIGSGPRRAVGWLTNAPGLDIASKYRSVRKAISEEWECRDIRLDPPAKISPEISVLIVISPREFTDVQLFEIDQYLMRGGRILVLLEGYSPQSRRGSDGRQLVESIAAQPTNLTRLLDRCGLKVNQEVVLDPSQCAFAPTAAGMRMRYPFWVSITDSGLNKNNPAVMRLQRIILPWTQTFDATSSKPAGVEMIPLAWTSPNSLVRWGATINPGLDVATRDQSARGTTHTVIAALTGKFPSCFTQGTSYPLDTGTTVPATARTQESERLYISNLPTQIIVVGNSLWLQEDFLMTTMSWPWDQNNNAVFLLNATEWLGLGKGLAEIRSRQPIARPIRSDLSDRQRSLCKVGGTLASPLLVIVGGFLFNVIRRRRRRVIADRLLKWSA